MRPRRTLSLSMRSLVVTRLSLTKVPLVDPRSLTRNPWPVAVNSAWRPLIDDSFITTSQSVAVPTTARPLSWNSSPVCGPSSGTSQPTPDPCVAPPPAPASMAIVRILPPAGAGAGAAAAAAGPGAAGPSDQPQYGH